MDESVDRLGRQEDRGLGGWIGGWDRGWEEETGKTWGWVGGTRGGDRGWAGGPWEVTGAGRGDQGR